MPERTDNSGGREHDATRVIRTSGDVIGRDTELAALARALDEERVVGIWGPPGVGKSRLARAHARAAGRQVVCDLAGARSVEAAERRLMVSLGVDAPPQELSAASAARLDRLLLEQDARVVVLDHADQVTDVGALLTRLNRLTTAVRFIVTSRARIDAAGVSLIRLSGLSPQDGRELFVARAQAARPDFVGDDIASIDAVVKLVDGLPLAIELAASRIRVMAPAGLARRVAERLDVLKSQSAGDARHTSLRAAFDDSWEMLGEAQRRTLAGCAIFEDWFDLEAAEEVVQPHVDGDVIDTVEQLIELSLIQSAFYGDSLKFRLLRTVREYAWAELGDPRLASHLEEGRDQHLLRRAEQVAASIRGPRGAAAFADLDAQHDVLLGALERFQAGGRLDEMSRLLWALRWHIVFRGPLERYETALAAAVDSADGSQRSLLAATYAEALLLRGERTRAAELMSVAEQSNEDQAVRLTVQRVATMLESPARLCETLETLVAAARDAGDGFMQARALERLGLARTQANKIDGAWMAFTQARELYAVAGAQFFLSGCATGLGYVELRLSRLDDAIACFREAVQGYDASANHFLAASARFNLGVALHTAGQTDAAAAELGLALEAWRVSGFTRYCVPGLVRLGLAQLEGGEVDLARSSLAEAVRLGRECQDHHNAAIAYVERACLDFARGRPVDFDELERMAPGISAGADPDAFASALVLLLAVAAAEHRPALSYVNRLEELAAMFADGEPHIKAVVGMLRDIARSWHCLSTARTATDEGVKRQNVARAWEWGSVMIAGTPKELHNPFVRLWSSRLGQFGAEFSNFAPLAETFRAVLLAHRTGDWYQVDGRSPVDLATRRPLRLVMGGLIELAESDAVTGLDVDALAAIGWPGEVLDLATRRNRVYTAVRFLREMDLEDVLVKDDSGYRFATDVALRVTEEPLGSG